MEADETECGIPRLEECDGPNSPAKDGMDSNAEIGGIAPDSDDDGGVLAFRNALSLTNLLPAPPEGPVEPSPPIRDGSVEDGVMPCPPPPPPLPFQDAISSPLLTLPPPSSIPTLAMLDERRKPPVMVTEPSLRITDDAEARTNCSLRERGAESPGKGRTSRDQMSARRASSRARSARGGARTVTRVVGDGTDCDRLIGAGLGGGVSLSFVLLVFLRMTWQRGGFGPMVVARLIEMFLA